jgi:uncharacterized protein (TIGR00725 family)
MLRMVVAVSGGGTCSATEAEAAFAIGRLLAEHGVVVATGGRGGVMEAASSGAREAGGLVLGILPGASHSDANPFVDIAIPTGMGELRNGILVRSAHAVIAVGGEYGTLSEVAFALKLGIPVIGLGTWKLARDGMPGDGIVTVHTPDEAVEKALTLIGS